MILFIQKQKYLKPQIIQTFQKSSNFMKIIAIYIQQLNYVKELNFSITQQTSNNLPKKQQLRQQNKYYPACNMRMRKTLYTEIQNLKIQQQILPQIKQSYLIGELVYRIQPEGLQLKEQEALIILPQKFSKIKNIMKKLICGPQVQFFIYLFAPKCLLMGIIKMKFSKIFLKIMCLIHRKFGIMQVYNVRIYQKKCSIKIPIIEFHVNKLFKVNSLILQILRLIPFYQKINQIVLKTFSIKVNYKWLHFHLFLRIQCVKKKKKNQPPYFNIQMQIKTENQAEKKY
ncbi:hypothetical protein IMG5_005510 [Ichthyophthirius multifiliis]|uniref:Transmembrane protein n=1 Tax=Ichthyophthirius multifiliis TaxID=5932 RepID=G0QJH8_ICHMU|nr:hypothetical protein IMG5_005510 [Ichthyophthirius multifiliis]EGR34629.1 hypothetical protein IMG5_005510 [Ichthyophthirius multifiliis]|eukprot:XP_004039933.1 hypothetical protein IMG5_005510 [Ichthyophthirius multifiliis]